MKKLITILLLILGLTASATNYYVSSSGNDAAAGTLAAPWLTIAKVNSYMASMASGDTVFFNRGNTFFGAIVVSKSGIVFSAYGSGNRPIISGFVSVSGWSDIGSGKFQSAVTTAKNIPSIFTINGTVYTPARTPNSGYYSYQTSTSSRLIDTALNASPSYTGAELIYRPNHYWLLRAKITSHSTDTLNFSTMGTIDPTGTGLSMVAGKNNFGYFIQRHLSCLDQWGEWVFDSASKRVTAYGDLTGYTVKISTIDTLVRCGNYTDLVFDNISFEGAGLAAIYSAQGSGLTIKNCVFNNSTYGVFAYNTSDISIVDNSFTNTFCQAIGIAARQKENFTVTGNTIYKNGLLVGIGVRNYDMQLKGITVESDSDRVSNNTVIQLNSLDSIGSAGIQFQGSNVLVDKNAVTNFCETISDHGGIYTFRHNADASPSKAFVNRVISNNIVLNSSGATAGTSDGIPDVSGIYLDDFSDSVTVSSNTVANIPGNGLQANNTQGVTFRANTVYNCTYAVNVNKKPFTDINRLRIYSNILFPANVNQYNFLYTDGNLTLPTSKTIAQSLAAFGSVDSNFIHTAKAAGFAYYYSPTGTSTLFPTPYTLMGWQGIGKDVNSTQLTVPSDSMFRYNASSLPISVTFAGKIYSDSYGTAYSNFATIPAWSSIILLRTGTVLPANRVTIKGIKFINKN